jgi:hypothetical protein
MTDSAPEPRDSTDLQGRVGCALLIVLGGVGSALFAFGAWRPADAAPGMLCDEERQCVEGADCMTMVNSDAVLPGSRGTCVLRCGAECPPERADECGWDCPAGQVCSREHCLTEVKADAACGETVKCEEHTECMAVAGAQPRCLKQCIDDSVCAAGQRCTPVDTRPRLMHTRSPIDVWPLQRVCLAAPSSSASADGGVR